ncbi:MAG: arylsulfatase [Bacteroidota bacterium]
MKPFIFLAAILLFSISFIAGAQTKAKPNIIIILADDLGWGDVGYHGSTIKTPNIDKFAKDGIELKRFYTAALCSPTRAGILTGRYPDRVGLRSIIPPWSKFGVDTSEVFLPQVLAEAGYKNRAIIGKWHLGHSSLKYHPLNRGFTHFYGFLNGYVDYFSHKREGELDWHNDFKPSYDSGYSTDLIADEAVKSIKNYVKESPFFLYVAFNASHSPLQAKKTDLLKYGYDESKPSFPHTDREGEEGRGNTKAQTYAAIVSNMDENIGRILKTLKDLNIENNTIVLFESDNGAQIAEGGSSGSLRGSKGTEWEGGVRAPAIIRWPAGFKGGRSSDQLMGYIDVMPTLLDIAGVDRKPIKRFDGISVLPALTGKVLHIDRNFYLGLGAIVNQDWKLIVAAKAGPQMNITEDQLFKISTDFSEKENVAGQHKKEYDELKNELERYSNIKPAMVLPPFALGRKGFVAPKEWTIKD